MAIKNKSELPREKHKIDLTGPDGNAFVLMGQARRWLKDSGADTETIDSVMDEMMSGDYENLITVFDRYFGEICDLYR